MSESTPPHDIEAEQITLGAMMLSPAALSEIAAIIASADQYFRPAHRVIHAVITHLHEAGEPTDPVAVRLEMERRGELHGSVDGTYLHTLVAAVATPSSGPYYARKVAKAARTRRLQEGLQRALQMAAGAAFDPDADMDLVRQAVDEATGEPGTGNAAWVSDAVLDVLSAIEKPLPPDEITVPYADLRAFIRALRPGQLITVAARPSIGKTVVVGDFARHVALQLGLPVAWFSLEMSREEIITRSLAAEARVNHEHLQEHTLSDGEWDRLSSAAKRFGESRLLIDDQSASDLGYMRSLLRGMSRITPPRMVVVDYLQLATSPGAPSRQEEVARLARGLKALASDFGVPVLMAAQLNRNPEGRHDKRPMQSDLRESGEIENSSDVVILLHREDYYERESPRAGEMDLIISKNRNGKTGNCTVAFQGRFCRCVGMAREDTPSAEWTPSTVLGGRQ